MKRILVIGLLFLSSSILIVNCNKEDRGDSENLGNSLSEKDNAFLESVSVANPSLKEMLSFEGDPLEGFTGSIETRGDRGKLINDMLRDAQSLSGQKIILFPQVGTDPFQPAHMGLVYSYGQRDVTQRSTPPQGNELHKRYAVYGTDCSGLMINLLRHAGVNIQNTNVEDFESELKYALGTSNNSKGLTITNIGYQTSNELNSGDFIVWGISHIGIIDKLTNNRIIVFQSNGNGEPSDEAQHIKNLGLGRGVHPIDYLDAINKDKGYWGTGYHILRFKYTGNDFYGYSPSKTFIYTAGVIIDKLSFRINEMVISSDFEKSTIEFLFNESGCGGGASCSPYCSEGSREINKSNSNEINITYAQGPNYSKFSYKGIISGSQIIGTLTITTLCGGKHNISLNLKVG